MIKTKTYEFKNRIYSEIPQEVAEKLDIKAGDELFFEIGEDIKIKPLKGNSFLSTEEKTVLSNLNDIKHNERTKKRVDAEFDSKIIDKMIAKKILFRYAKEDAKMIGVDRKFASFKISPGILGELDIYGFLILEDYRIKELSYALENAKRTGDVIGIRGFDKKFYVMLNFKLKKYRNLILEEIKEPKSVFEISKKLKVSDAFCKTALEIIKEQGDVIEKKKDVFQAI